jgi:hypothetical protein
MHGQTAMHKLTFGLLVSLASLGCGEKSTPPRPDPVAAVAPAAPAAAGDAIPPDGAMLFAFMLERIPDLAMKVPCSCCRYTIGECYKGACPPQCGACNKIGRDVYTWHQQGIGDDEILARVRNKYPR